MTFIFVFQWFHLYVEGREAVPIKELSVLLLAVSNGNHFAAAFENSITFLHTPKHIRHKVLLTKQAIKRILLDDYIKLFVVKGEFLSYVVMHVFDPTV